MAVRIGLLTIMLLLAAGCAGEAQREPAPQRAFLEQQLVELDSLPRPAGVAPQVWQGLKATLAQAIEGRVAGAGKSVRSAPTTDAARTPLKFNLDTQAFEWRLYNPGDYDQNGEVNISDLTPLAVHLNKAVPAGPGGSESVISVVDGDGNGVVTIADITPLGANLGRRITQFNLYATTDIGDYPSSNAAPSSAGPAGSISAADYSGERTTERVRYALPGALINGWFFWLRPADDTDQTEGTPSTTVSGDGELRAVLKADRLGGAVPLSVQFDASESSGSGALAYSFDLDGDGGFTPASGPTAAMTYDSSGTFAAAVRVEDSGGLVATQTVHINARTLASWHRYPVPVSQSVESVRFVACGYADGLPWYFSGHDSTAAGFDTTSFSVAQTSSGSNWRRLTSSTFADNLARYADVTVAAGLPAVLFATTDGSLNFAQAGSPFPSSWGLGSFNAGDTDDLASFSTAVVGGVPMTAYTQNDNLMVKRAIDVDGSNWWAPIAAVDAVDGTSAGFWASLAMVDAKPAIAYYETDIFSGTIIKYVDAQTSSGVSWNVPVEVADSGGSLHFYDSLIVLADGSPALVYYDDGNYQIVFARANSDSGNVWADSFVVDSMSLNADTSVPRAFMVGDIPHAVWYDPESAELMHSRATDPDGLSWELPAKVAGDVSGTVMPCPMDAGGYPAVAYCDSAGLELKFAILY